ncbi:hypothetical protein GCM10025864_27270 [Luteimicrobium album]|uniref:SelT/SelW/SelH family protein n=1 Tax=Luteimicrobium album TaxID=1054550 RepID=A0ABQ6I4R7_9MICO|nr:SelT/SelW/SelH family protein [Luteimicrobium album]GMA24968.1 hypothetical protein GCM10025864_27270 [Luteimicrobium album]
MTEVAGGGLPKVRVEYCTQCRWMLRASWVAQELLTTFGTRLGEVALVPGTGGVFRVTVRPDDGAAERVIWDRAVEDVFPELPQLKARLRDVVAPDLALGHTDRAARRAEGAPDA